MRSSNYPPRRGSPRRPAPQAPWQNPQQPVQPAYRPEQPYRPVDPWDPTQVTPVQERQPQTRAARVRQRQAGGYPRPKRTRWFLACGPLLLLALPFVLLLGIYLLAPGRTNILLLGIDTRSWKSALGRSDTMILTTVVPTKPYVGMLSIPRDLWVTIPGIGENRINTAHFYAESQVEDSGPSAAMDTVQSNFGVDVKYYVRIRFSGFADVVDALGGLDIVLPEPMSGYTAGQHHLTGSKALALVRDRSGSDDFFRMQRGQIFMKAVFKQIRSPKVWPRLPGAMAALVRAVDTNIPVWLWPRLGLALLRAGPDGIDGRTITREMVTNTFVGDANVLLPNWDLINPVLLEMFGQ